MHLKRYLLKVSESGIWRILSFASLSNCMKTQQAYKFRCVAVLLATTVGIDGKVNDESNKSTA